MDLRIQTFRSRPSNREFGNFRVKHVTRVKNILFRLSYPFSEKREGGGKDKWRNRQLLHFFLSHGISIQKKWCRSGLSRSVVRTLASVLPKTLFKNLTIRNESASTRQPKFSGLSGTPGKELFSRNVL